MYRGYSSILQVWTASAILSAIFVLGYVIIKSI